MKDVSNGWEYTPRVRLSVLNPGHRDTVNRPSVAFPLPSQQSVAMHLDAATSSLSWDSATAPVQASSAVIDGKTGVATFDCCFTTRTELTGFFGLKLFVSSPTDAPDMDIFVKTSKLGPDGDLLEACCVDVGYLADDPEKERAKLLRLHKVKNASIDSVWFAEGTTGRLRVSHRARRRSFHPALAEAPASAGAAPRPRRDCPCVDLALAAGDDLGSG
jgi:hypothetical protein